MFRSPEVQVSQGIDEGRTDGRVEVNSPPGYRNHGQRGLEGQQLDLIQQLVTSFGGGQEGEGHGRGGETGRPVRHIGSQKS